MTYCLQHDYIETKGGLETPCHPTGRFSLQFAKPIKQLSLNFMGKME